MYTIKWTTKANLAYLQTLVYWREHNKSNSYSLKIQRKVAKLVKDLEKNPFFLSRYWQNKDVYQRIFFKGKFSIFFQITNETTVNIIHFQSNSQKPFL